MRRIAAVVLPSLRIELVQAELDDTASPLALVVAKDGGPVKDERSLLGNTRLDEVSAEAAILGVRAGQTIAAARARCASLRVRVVALDAVRSALARIAEMLLAFGATTSFAVAENTVWVDVTGCAHLHQSANDASGEATLAARIRERVWALPFACSVGIADGPQVAAAVARYRAREGVIVVPAGGNAAALIPLPLQSLPLSDDAIHWLMRLGIAKVGDLARIPRASLALRLGAAAPNVMALLAGEDSTPLTAHVPPVIPEEVATLEYGIESTEALVFVVKRLCDGIACRIAGRALAISRLEVIFKLDRGMAPSRPTAVLDLVLSAPFTEAAELLRVVRARLDSYTIEAPILAVVLRGLETVPRQTAQTHLFVPEAKAERVIPRLAAELEAELGHGVVGTLQLGNRWLPEHRSTLVPLRTTRALHGAWIAAPDSHVGSLLSGAPEPTRWLPDPLVVPDVMDVKIAARVEACEWWTRGVHRAAYGTAWIETVPALAWVELDAADRILAVRGWMD